MLLESMHHLAVGLEPILTGALMVMGVVKGLGVLLLSLLGVLLLWAIAQGLFALMGIRKLALRVRRGSFDAQQGASHRSTAARPRWLGRRG